MKYNLYIMFLFTITTAITSSYADIIKEERCDKVNPLYLSFIEINNGDQITYSPVDASDDVIILPDRNSLLIAHHFSSPDARIISLDGKAGIMKKGNDYKFTVTDIIANKDDEGKIISKDLIVKSSTGRIFRIFTFGRSLNTLDFIKSEKNANGAFAFHRNNQELTADDIPVYKKCVTVEFAVEPVKYKLEKPKNNIEASGTF